MNYKAVYMDRSMAIRRQRQLSRSTYVDEVVSRVSMIKAKQPRERNSLNLTLELLIATADLLGCSTDYLLGRTDEPKPYPPPAEADISSNNLAASTEVAEGGNRGDKELSERRY